MESSKKIAILGAGPSGLVACKEAIENGLIPTIFESKNDIGGVWSSTGAVWNTMHTNISKFTTTFSDFDWDQGSEMFPTAQAMLNYLNEYARKWNIRNYIKFHSNVVNVSSNCNESEKIGANGWTVKWIEDSHSTLQTDTFDGVIVATGIFSKGYIPELPGLGSFSGKVLHSKEYKTGQAFEGLRVLTVGGSFSGAEIASDVSNYSSISYHCFREPFWILKRYLPDKKSGKAYIPLDLLSYTRSIYQQTVPVSAVDSNTSKNRYMASICSEQQNITELRIESQNFDRPHNVTISDQYLNLIGQKRLIAKRQLISEINGSTVTFQNGDTVDVDIIICCTGYSPDLNFLDKNVLQKILYDPTDRLQPVILFHECCHPDVENLFFVGMYKGPYFAVMEQQARLAARVFSGNVTLPSTTVMLDGLKREKAIRDAHPRPQFPHPEYVRFADEISKCAGSFPDLNKFKDNTCTLADAFGKPLKPDALQLEQHKAEIYERFMTESVIPCHYNLVHDPVGTIHRMDEVQESIKKMC